MSAQQQALQLLTQARQVINQAYQQLQQQQTADQLFEMRIELQDACDVIREATRYIEREQRAVEPEII